MQAPYTYHLYINVTAHPMASRARHYIAPLCMLCVESPQGVAPPSARVTVVTRRAFVAVARVFTSATRGMDLELKALILRHARIAYSSVSRPPIVVVVVAA